MQSNVNIVSNVYVRSNSSLNNDRFSLETDHDFVSKIIDPTALKQIVEMYPGSSSRVKLTDLQNEILKNSVSCMHRLAGERTHGVVHTNSGEAWVCRCENYNCPGAKDCKPPKAERTCEPHADTDFTSNELLWLNIEINNVLFEANQATDDEDEVNDIVESKTYIGEYELISPEQAVEKIIRSDISSKIMVNAAPGTGKTYTVIQRLLYILSLDEITSADGILVLCYTRAAVEEIKNRIEKEIAHGQLPAFTRNIAIGTLDSFASSYLAGIKNFDLMGKGYNERIELFNTEYDANDLENFDYCIIDEIQDIVNERARMVLNILKAIKCGFLLLGDKCQAIYDYDINSESVAVKSPEFYEKLLKILPIDTKYYELDKNLRQCKELTIKSSNIRNAILSETDNIENIFRKELAELSSSSLKDRRYIPQTPTERVAILCRNNGQAESVSAFLHKNNIDHILVKSTCSRNLIGRSIADILWDHSDDIVTRDEFVERAAIRCKMNIEQSGELFNMLRTLSGEDEETSFFEMQKLAVSLNSVIDLPEVLLEDYNCGLYVSTIHKSKGREFDRVFLFDGNSYKHRSGNNEEERVYYVAVTRAKNQLELLNRYETPSIVRGASGHCMKLDYFKKRSTAITVGIYDDVNYFSFSAGDLERAVNLQSYIANNIKPNDIVSLCLNDRNRYDIIHNSFKIGEMSEHFNQALCGTYGKGKQYFYNKLPPLITNIFVNKVFTFVSYKDDEKNPVLFRHNRFWLGVELAGFGTFKWENR